MTFKQISLIILSVLFLTFSYTNNGLNATNQDYFNQFQCSSEGLIINRIVNNRNSAFFDKGGLPGWFEPRNPSVKNKAYAYYLFSNGVSNNEPFKLYKTHHGFQAIIYSILDQYLLHFISPANRLFAFHLLTSLLNSLIFVFLVITLKKRYKFSIITYFVLIFSLAFAQFIVPFGNNLWWVIGIFFIPFLASIYIQTRPISTKKIVLLSGSAMLVKYFFTGYEYITTIWVMTVLPFILSLVSRNILDIKKFLEMIFGLISATAISVLLLVVQIKVAVGSWSEGWNHLLYSFLKRSHGKSTNLEEIYLESTQANLLSLIRDYMNEVWLDLSHVLGTNLPIYFRVIKWWEILALLLMITIFNFVIKANKSRYQLMLLSYASLLAPFSWLIIFKGHSYIHTHMNHVIWWMPSAFFILIFITESLISYTHYFKKTYIANRF